MKKSVCIIAFSTIAEDARVLRQIKYLSCDYDLTVIGYGPPHSDWIDEAQVRWVSVLNARSVLLTKLLGLLLILAKIFPLFYDYWYWRTSRHVAAFEQALTSHSHLFYANDWEALPLAAEAARRTGARLIFDVHEYAPLELENIWHWRLIQAPLVTHFLRRYFHLADASITINALIAERYKQEFQVEPITVLNAPEFVSIPPKSVQADDIKLVHHGAAIRARGLERMIETIALCDRRYSLHLMLLGSDRSYLKYLRRLANQLAPDRVLFHEPVAPEEIVPKIAEYDMGFCFIEPSNYNTRVTLPNKFFDFIMAGLAICIGPSPAMAEIVRKYSLGCVAPTFEPSDIAPMLNQLTISQIATMQQAARTAATRFNADREMQKVIDLHQRLLAEGT